MLKIAQIRRAYNVVADIDIVFIVRLVYFSVIGVLYPSLQYFDTVGCVFWPVKTVSHSPI